MESIATVVDKPVSTKEDTVELICSTCNNYVNIPLKTYNAMIGDKDWRGEWIKYTQKELESKYSKEELKKMESMTADQLMLVAYKIVNRDNVFCMFKCLCDYTHE